MSNKIKMGIIGISPGNGHPYSWSAIINGYDKDLMAKCPFPTIPVYLGKRKFPDEILSSAHISQIWTQSPEISREIAQTCNIENVSGSIEEMIETVDAVILARDDAENHSQYSSAILKSGLPIFIDKPIAYKVLEAKKLFEMQAYPGQIFTCSALRFAEEFAPLKTCVQRIGKILQIDAVVPKSWEKYSIHVIEPIVANLKLSRKDVISFNRISTSEYTQLRAAMVDGMELVVTAILKDPTDISISVNGSNGTEKYVFTNPFSAFKSGLQEFIEAINNRRSSIRLSETLDVIEFVEMGVI